jgi:hypothetical protein
VGLAAAFAAINPYLLKEWEKAWAEIWSIVEVLYFWQPGDPVWTVRHGVWQVVKPLGQGAGGWLGLAAALAGMGVAAWKREWRVLLAAQPVVATFAILLPFEHTVPYRYLLPALPGLAVLAAYAFRSVNRAPRALVWGAAALALGAVELKTSVELVRRLGEEDTRSMAGAWIRKNVPKGVPVVYLGGAECEPQFEESAGSIERRMEYVNRRYGPVSGAIIAAPYKLMAEARRRGGGRGWEVHRNPLPGTLPAGEKLVVTTEYPLRMTRYTAPYAEAAMEETRPGMVIQGMRLSGACRDFELDLIDAWFLPFRPLECVERPGPNIRMRWLREKGR